MSVSLQCPAWGMPGAVEDTNTTPERLITMETKSVDHVPLICRIPAPELAGMTNHELEAELHHRDGLARVKARRRRMNPKTNAARRAALVTEVELRYGRPELFTRRAPVFPKGLPEMRLSARLGDPANLLRDLFYANEGRISRYAMSCAVGRLTINYGWPIHETWAGLVDEQYAVLDGDDWVWPLALPENR